jgi:CubicO group peptidase (beta-lactamase class C family)
MSELPAVDTEALDALCARTQRNAARAGCAVQLAVACRGALAGFRTFGRARHGDGRERDADGRTLFAIFSVTKAIVSSAAWILLRERRLALGDRVAEHVPEFATHGKDIVTVEQLLTHEAGFPSAQLPPEEWLDPERRLRRFASWRLEWEPGSRFVYHGSATMWVLAELITRITGLDYRDFVRTRICEPLGLRDLFIGLPSDENARVAEVVPVGEPASDDRAAASPVDAPVLDEAMLARANLPESRAVGSPGGGGIATAADVALFYQGLLADAEGRGAGIWHPQMLREAWTARHPHLIDPMTKHAALRGLGVVIAGERDRMWRGFAEACSPRSFGHMGAGGQISWADPESGLSFACFTNGAERNPARQGATGFRLSSLAAACVPSEVA